MQGLFGLIKQELHRQDKLPMKYYDVPSEPVRSGCVFYVDGINNNGGSHSNTTTKWTPIIGSVKGTKMGSVKWGDKCMIQTDPCNGGYYFGKLPAYSNITVEAVFKTEGYVPLVCDQEGAGMILYQVTPTNQNLTRLGFSRYDKTTSSYVVKYDNTYTKRYSDRIVYACVRVNASSYQMYSSVPKIWFNHEGLSVTPKASTAPLALGYNPKEDGSIYVPSVAADKIGTCNIYAVRIYNRLLTDAEVEANMIYDKNRYGF